MEYTLNEILAMKTIEDEDYRDHPYGELKEYTDKERVWFDKETNLVIVEKFDYGMGTGWQVEEEYIAN
jgi:hypothetical protein